MSERSAFWRGVAAGVFGGMAVGVVVRLSAAAPRETNRTSGIALQAQGPPRITRSHPLGLSRSLPQVALRRESAESAGDPRITAPGSHRNQREVSGRAFERPPGAPGGRTPAERLELPGRPGKHTEHVTHPSPPTSAKTTTDTIW